MFCSQICQVQLFWCFFFFAEIMLYKQFFCSVCDISTVSSTENTVLAHSDFSLEWIQAYQNPHVSRAIRPGCFMLCPYHRSTHFICFVSFLTSWFSSKHCRQLTCQGGWGWFMVPIKFAHHIPWHEIWAVCVGIANTCSSIFLCAVSGARIQSFSSFLALSFKKRKKIYSKCNGNVRLGGVGW